MVELVDPEGDDRVMTMMRLRLLKQGGPAQGGVRPLSEGLAFEILDLAGDAVIVIDAGHHVQLFNQAAERTFGYAAADIVGKPLSILLPERFRGRHDHHMHTFRGAQSPRLMGDRAQILALRRDGTEFPAEASLAWIDRDGAGVYVVVLRDITARLEAERRTARLGLIIEQSINEIYVFDAGTLRFLLVNNGARENLDYSAEDLVSLTPLDLMPAYSEEAFRTLVGPLVDGTRDQVVFETVLLRRDGSTYEVEVRLQLMPAETPPVFVAIARDVTERSRFETIIRRQSYYDSLTLLPNRALLLERLTQAVQECAAIGAHGGLLLVDFGDIRLVNDSLGRESADQLIKEAARRIGACLRSRDTLARLEGNTFAVVLPHLDGPRAAGALTERLLGVLQKPFDLGSYQTLVHSFIGISSFPEDGSEPQTLVRCADAAMWRARKEGETGYRYYTADLNEAAKGRLAIKSGLAKALAGNEFSLVYQPRVALTHWEVCGVEALLRWKSPELGPVSPAAFIPVLEETGMILPVGAWVLDTACAMRRRLIDRGHVGVCMAVNLSVRQIRHGLKDDLRAILDRHGLVPTDIELEITESAIMNDGEAILTELQDLAALGVPLSTDDFGSGYSSLNYLKRLPLSTIKVDRSFITDVANDPTDAEIVRAIVAMGHSMGRRIVAEGVETEQQLAYLRLLGCDEIQGYLFSRPIPEEELFDLLDRHGS